MKHKNLKRENVYTSIEVGIALETITSDLNQREEFVMNPLYIECKQWLDEYNSDGTFAEYSILVSHIFAFSKEEDAMMFSLRFSGKGQ